MLTIMRTEQLSTPIQNQEVLQQQEELRVGAHPLEEVDAQYYSEMDFEERKHFAKNRAQVILLTKYIDRICAKAKRFIDNEDVFTEFAEAFNDYLKTHEEFRSVVYANAGDFSVLPDGSIEDMISYLVDHPETQTQKVASDSVVQKALGSTMTH